MKNLQLTLWFRPRNRAVAAEFRWTNPTYGWLVVGGWLVGGWWLAGGGWLAGGAGA